MTAFRAARKHKPLVAISQSAVSIEENRCTRIMSHMWQQVARYARIQCMFMFFFLIFHRTRTRRLHQTIKILGNRLETLTLF